MKLYLDADVEMEATYAYYFSGTIVPPAVTGTYAFFSLEASAYLGLRMEGNARFQAGTGRKKLLDTISYPGLAIKGIAAVGPTLDLYGEVIHDPFVCIVNHVLRQAADPRNRHPERRDESRREVKLWQSRGLLATRRRSQR